MFWTVCDQNVMHHTIQWVQDLFLIMLSSLQDEHKIVAPPSTPVYFVDILAMHAVFCIKFTQLLSKKIYILTKLLKFIWGTFFMFTRYVVTAA